MDKIRFCRACGKQLILDKEHHKILRDDAETGLATIGRTVEPKLYDGFDCDYCGCQTIVGERKREVYVVEFKDTKEDIKVESELLNERISGSDDGINEDDIADIRKKIDEAGE